jgi:hypothetical protein
VALVGLPAHREIGVHGMVERQLRALNAAFETLLDVVLDLHDIRPALASPGLGTAEARELRNRRAALPLRVEAVADDFSDAVSERRLSPEEVIALWRRACRVSEIVACERGWERLGDQAGETVVECEGRR